MHLLNQKANMTGIWIEHDKKLYNLDNCYLVLCDAVEGDPVIMLFTSDYNSILKFEDKTDRNNYFEYIKALLVDEECDNIA